jgi:hypothetical protein
MEKGQASEIYETLRGVQGREVCAVPRSGHNTCICLAYFSGASSPLLGLRDFTKPNIFSSIRLRIELGIKVIRRAVPRNNFSKCLFYILYFCRYMFRPLLAIFRWNAQLFLEDTSTTTDPLFCDIMSYLLYMFGKYCRCLFNMGL